MTKLQDQVVIVTGAGRGIGRAIAHKCAAAGAKVALTSRTEAQLQQVAGEIRDAGGTALVIPADVTDQDSVNNMVQTTETELGPVDLLVNNAGSFFSIGPAWETDPTAWWRDVTINVLGVYLGCHAVLPGMIERGQGRVINLIGGGTTNPFPYGSGYGTSKAAVMRFTETLAVEAKEHGVKVFAMGPGLVRTALTEFQMESEEGRRWMARIVNMLETGKDVPPTLAGELAVEIGSGRFDALVGRAVSVGFDHEAMATRADEIIEKDLYTLRLNRLDE